VAANIIRVLVVDDYGDWRTVIRSMFARDSKLSIAGEAEDGLEAIEKIAGLQPDLIVLDIGLPKLNGLEVLSRARELSPDSKVLMVSEMRSAEIALEALRRGALGYVVKSGAANELLPAVEAAVEGRQFLSNQIAGAASEDGERNGSGHAVTPDGTRHCHSWDSETRLRVEPCPEQKSGFTSTA
jgi:DNA-binding NarL/FixJ family response regulator